MLTLELTPQSFDFILTALSTVDPTGIFRPKELVTKMNEAVIAYKEKEKEINPN